MVFANLGARHTSGHAHRYGLAFIGSTKVKYCSFAKCNFQNIFSEEKPLTVAYFCGDNSLVSVNCVLGAGK